jgi:hypothetical protein
VPDLASQLSANAQYKSLMPMIERLRFGFHRGVAYLPSNQLLSAGIGDKTGGAASIENPE